MKRSYLLAFVLGLFLVSGSDAQYPVLDAIANKVIQKYQQSSCEQLWEQKGQPKSQQEQEAVQILRNDPQRRAAFIDKVAAPIANKMFECGMIP
jgi:ABC-type Fe2+-enterobactin transport system substrate-binding protein